MFKLYGFIVLEKDWFVCLKDQTTKEIIHIHNDVDALKSVLASNGILVGFDNYKYDDIILWAILSDQDVYSVHQQVKNGTFTRSTDCGVLTLDAMQEITNSKDLSITDTLLYLGRPVIHRNYDGFYEMHDGLKEEIRITLEYIVNGIDEVFASREDYFTTKFDIVDTYKMKVRDVKSTRSTLVGKVLKARAGKNKFDDHFNLTFDENLPLHELPKELVDFYLQLIADFKAGHSVESLRTRSIEVTLNGILHTFGFGGTHGAKNNYVGEGKFLHIDAKSYYPTLMINNNFMSRAAAAPERYFEIYEERLRLLALGESLSTTSKEILNTKFGSMNSPYSKLYDPLQFYNTTVNGQLILVHLIVLLQPFCELIQSNSDGIIIKFEDELHRNMINDVIELFSKRYKLNFTTTDINKVVQRDVNNYAVRYTSGKIKAIGFMKRHEGGSWERNSLTVVDTALLNYYMHGIEIQTTIINLFKKDITAFQMIAKKGAFDNLVHEQFEDGEMKLKIVPDVSRIFATKSPYHGMMYKAKGRKYHKLAGAPESCFIFNGDIADMDRKKIDLNWYVKLVKEKLFK